MLLGSEKYKESTALAYYHVYYYEDVGLSATLEAVVPLINLIAGSVFETSGQGNASQFAMDALEHIYELLEAKAIPRNSGAFTSYISTSCRREMMRSLLYIKKEEFDFANTGLALPHGKVHDQGLMIYIMNYRDIVVTVVDEVLSRIRFSGDEYRICCYAVDELTEGKVIAKKFLAKRFQLSIDRIEWLYQYVNVLYRIVTMRVLKDEK